MTSSVVTHPAENVWIGLHTADARLRLHLSTLAWRSHVALLDQPCHADVLIELANGGEA